MLQLAKGSYYNGMSFVQFIGAVELGLIYSLVAIGVYLTFRLIDFPDLTVDGSFPLGGAIAATLIVDGFDPIMATLLAFVGGWLSGLVTAYLNLKWKIMGLLAGILTMTGLYSINLRIMGRPNITLMQHGSVFGVMDSKYVFLMIVVALVVIGLVFLIRSEFGLSIRAIGTNERFARALGISFNRNTYFTLGLSNGIVALSGALFSQSSGFTDITMGQGTIIIGLASVIIGETLFWKKNVYWLLIGCVMGSIIYKLVVALALNLNFKTSDLKLITALLIIIIMILPKVRHKLISTRGKK